MLSISDLDAEFRFYWRKKLRRCLPHYIGAVRVSVTQPACVSTGELDRLVFRVPEFFEGGNQILCVDSFHYHRVTSLRSAISSQRVPRNTLSFRTIHGIWRAGIFDCSNGRLKKNEIERRVRYGVISQIEEVLACYERGTLPASRRLLSEEVRADDILFLHGIPAADDRRLFASYA